MPSYIRTRSEFAINSFTAQNQVAPSVATFADGGFIVAWGTADATQDGQDSAIKAQLFDSAGSKVGFEFLVNSSAPGAQFTPSVATLSNGNFIVSWVTNITPDGTNEGIKAQLFSRSGQPIGGEIAVDIAEIGPFTPNVAPLAGGGFVISWDDWSGFDVKAQIFDAAGARVGSPFTVNTKTDAAQEYGDLTALAGGGFVATWRTTDSSADGSGQAVKAQIFDGSGNRVGTEFLVNTHKFDSQYDPSVASLAGGGFVITWATWDTAQDGNSGAVKGQVFDATGAKVGGEFLVNTQAVDIQRDAVVTGTPDGGFLVAWTNYSSSQDGSAAAIKAQAFDAAGTKIGGEFLVNTLFEGWQSMPDLATLADGRVIAVWSSGSGDSSGNSVRAQILGTEVAAELPNTRPIIISNGGGTSASLTMDEGTTAVTTVVASDDGEPNNLRYSITGGYNAELFTINALTGALAFKTAPDHVEGADNFYSVTVTVSDGELSSFQSIQVSLLHVNRVTIVSDGGGDHAEVRIAENQTAVTTVSALDEDGAALTYRIEEGEHSSLFVIDPNTGELSFAVPPDYEQPQDYYGDNVYVVYVTASDGKVSDTQGIAVVVTDVDEGGGGGESGVTITSGGGGDSAQVMIGENETAVTRVEASGSGQGMLTYQIVGGADAWQFAIDAETGELSFRYGPDADYPNDYDYDNVYEVIVRAGNEDAFDEQHLSVIVRNVDEAPIFYSYGGEERVALNMAENGWSVGTVAAWDPDGYHEVQVTYAIAGGADAALFEVDPSSGALTFVHADRPDFEAPADADGDNVYDVVVAAISGELGSTQAFSIKVRNENEGIFISSNGGGTSAAVSVDENSSYVTTVVGRDPDGTMATYSIKGGADASRFTIDAATGVLSFVHAPDFEAPGDAGADNFYTVEVAASDGEYTTWQTVQVQVGNVDEGVAFVSHGGSDIVYLNLAENQRAAVQVEAVDQDGGAVTYSITGGADAALFVVDSATGALSFVASPDFEAPADSDGDNVYSVVVTASDGGFSDWQAVGITIGDVNEAVKIGSNGGGATAAEVVVENRRTVTTVAANDPEGRPIVYAISGGADAALFTINAETGALLFVTAPDFEAPQDAGGNNVYDVVVSASDGTTTDTQALAVSVRNANEAVTISSGGGGSSAAVAVAENVASVTTVAATDADGGSVTYAITGGADAARFTIDSATGALAFVAAPNFEAPADAGSNNVYNVTVSASDGTFSDVQALEVTVTNVREGVTIYGNSSANTISTSKTVTGQPFATAGEDTIYGLGGADTLFGGGGGDLIDGGTGNDAIVGGAGADELIGGTGADRFILQARTESVAGAADLIRDFTRSQADRIDLLDIDANTIAGGNQSFAFIGTAAFSKVAGQLRFEQVGGNTFVSGDVNGDGVGDFQVQLQGLITLAASDFVL